MSQLEELFEAMQKDVEYSHHLSDNYLILLKQLINSND